MKEVGKDEDIQLSVQCRDGPLTERKCTDVFCCILYLLLLGSVIFLAVFASNAIQLTNSEVETMLEHSN